MINNIILISIDTLRYDCVGYQPDKSELEEYDVLKYLKTPTLDRIAEKSLCFTQCISTNSYTTASHASILTGLYPPRHGIREFYVKKLSNNVYTLAEILKIYGYTTVMFTDTYQNFYPTDLARGFDHFILRNDDKLFELLKTSKSNNNPKHFIFAHFFDVHGPYTMSENEKYNDGSFLKIMEELYKQYGIPLSKPLSRLNKYVIWNNFINHLGKDIHIYFPLYIQGVTKFDSGRFKDFIHALEQLGFMDDSLIMIFSDHGEGKSSVYKPDNFTHGIGLFDSVIRVPLIFYHKDITPGVTDKLVSLVDLFPTVLQSALHKAPQELLPYNGDGMHLLEHQSNRCVYSETWIKDFSGKHWNIDMISYLLFQRVLRTDSHKYVVFGMPERFDDIDIHAIPEQDFLQNYYRCLLCKFEPYDEFMETLTALKEKSIKREDIIASDNRQSYCYYDLKKDPREAHPIFLSKPFRPDVEEYFQKIIIMNRDAADAGYIFGEFDRSLFKELARKLFLKEKEDIIFTLSKNKHLLNDLIDKIILDQTLSDEEFVTSVYKIFFNRMPAENEKKEGNEFFQSGVSRRRYFNKNVFENESFTDMFKERAFKGDPYGRLRELEQYRYKYERLQASLIFKLFQKIIYFIDNILFPVGSKRRYIFSRILKKN